jgi:hypothetical protein
VLELLTKLLVAVEQLSAVAAEKAAAVAAAVRQAIATRTVSKHQKLYVACAT